MSDDVSDMLPSFSPDGDLDKPMFFKIDLECGITVKGTVKRKVFLNLIRDPSNLQSVIHEIPAGAAVTVVLPTSTVVNCTLGGDDPDASR